MAFIVLQFYPPTPMVSLSTLPSIPDYPVLWPTKIEAHRLTIGEYPEKEAHKLKFLFHNHEHQLPNSVFPGKMNTFIFSSFPH